MACPCDDPVGRGNHVATYLDATFRTLHFLRTFFAQTLAVTVAKTRTLHQTQTPKPADPQPRNPEQT